MTVSSTDLRADSNGNGVTTAFTVPFRFLEDSHLRVLKTNLTTNVATELTLTTDYTVTGAGDPAGGTVTCVTAPATGYKITILRNVPLDQQRDYVENDPFPAESHEEALDKLTMIAQQQSEELDRAITLPPAVTGVSTELPTPTASELIGWNSSGNALVNYAVTDLLTVAGSSGFSYQLANGGAASYTLNEDPGAIANLDVFVDGVRQFPVTDYTVSGTTVTPVVAFPAGTDNVLFKWGTTLGIGVPSDGSVGTAQLADSAVTSAKLADSAVATAKLADGAVTGVKLNDSVVNDLTTVTVASGDYVMLADVSDSNKKKKGLVSDIAALATSAGGFKNRIINGDMRIDQRNSGSSQTFTAGAAVAYCVDRFYASCTGANVTGQRVAGSGTDQYLYQFTGAASVTGIIFGQRIEATNIYDLVSTTATFSVELSNSLLTTVTWTAYYPTVTDNYTSKTQIATGTFTVNSTLATYSAQIALGANVTAGLCIELSVGAQTSGTWKIGRFQLESGSTATTFERRPIGVELALCQRYFEALGTVKVTTSAVNYGQIWFKASKRVTPTIAGGGAGYANEYITTESFNPYQSASANQALTATAEL